MAEEIGVQRKAGLHGALGRTLHSESMAAILAVNNR
jgi:hypothetical protein